MDYDSNWSRRIRAMAEDLGNLADEYDQTGQLEARDAVADAEEAVRHLLSLDDPDDLEEDN